MDWIEKIFGGGEFPGKLNLLAFVAYTCLFVGLCGFNVTAYFLPRDALIVYSSVGLVFLGVGLGYAAGTWSHKFETKPPSGHDWSWVPILVLLLLMCSYAYGTYPW